MKALRYPAFALTAALFVAATFFLFSHGKSKLPTFRISFWYWQTPFRLTPTESVDLKKLGVKILFVHAGTFSSDGTNMVLTVPQRYISNGGDLGMHLVFNFDGGVVHHFEYYDLELISGQIAKRVNAQTAVALRAGLKVEGIQFDFDCPTRLLPRYANLIDLVRSRLDGHRVQFSATGLMSWLGSGGVAELSRHVDFLVPQAYEGETGRTVDSMRTVSDDAYFRRKIGLARQLSCPFYVGVPAYGHGFLFDDQERLLTIYRRIEPDEALRHPVFRLTSAEPVDSKGAPARSLADSSGEEIIKFVATQAAPDGQGKGDRLGFTVQSPLLLAKCLASAESLQETNCLGAIIYRMPQEGSSLTLPWQSITAVLQHRPAKAVLQVKIATGRDNFERIESEMSDAAAPIELTVKLTNVGNASTFIAPDAAELDLKLDDAGIEDLQPRDFDSVETNSPMQSRASEVKLTKGYLRPGQTIYSGPIRLLSSRSQHIKLTLKVRQADGFSTTREERDLVVR